MSKYDWTNVPKEVEWIATDSDGWMSTHALKPEAIQNINWIDGSEKGYLATMQNSPFKGDWRDSLEERPK